ncbi:DUF3842 family protein [Oscillibacter sp. MSJ-2]|uniref:DUF3842 family protein n=1 Tax=Dysosmobacter acutus TaxID=2841504 RepID=A0ABS6F6S4_9FIRM|nr:DUF3842 family protein [Dysosmobacter acutus]MBU5625980.1 DUF3842 family protein [Dysosmobacter acutus]
MRSRILVIDGQGGKLGRSLIEAIRARCQSAEITAVGTNGLATSAMAKAKPDHIATGENAVMVCCRTAELIVGPIGIVIADSLLGEITPAMAVAVGQSPGEKLLLPVGGRCSKLVVGAEDLPVSALVEKAAEIVLEKLN